MKKDQSHSDEDKMRDEYDFSEGIRGKHYQSYREGHMVRIHRTDGTVLVQYFTQDEGSIMLDPDVKVHFPNSESVNKALRSLISQH